MSQHGLPLQISNVHYLAQLLLSAQLKAPEKATIGKLWVNCFIQCHPELKSKYTHQYNHHAKCEDPELIKGWFTCVHETMQKYGIVEKDIYNIDETGFQMSVASTAKVIYGSETRLLEIAMLNPSSLEITSR